MLRLHHPLFDFIDGSNFGALGYVIVVIFLFAWIVSFGVCKCWRMNERYAQTNFVEVHQHAHANDSGVTHSHEHLR